MSEENGSAPDTQSLGLTNRQVVAVSNAVRAAMSSVLVDRKHLAGKLGETYDGDRKIYEEAGYPKSISVTNYFNRYRRQGAARRIVDMPARTTWRRPPEITEPDRPDGTRFTAEVEALVDRLGLWRQFERADRLSRIGKYGLLLIGTADTSDQELRQPLDRLRGPDDIIYVRPRSEKDVEIEPVRNVEDSRFDLPELYTVQSRHGSHVWHHTRVLHIAEDLLEHDYEGLPALEAAFNDLLNLEKVGAGTGEGFWQQVVRTLMGEIDPEAEIEDDDVKELGEALEQMVNKLRRQIVTKGTSLRWSEGVSVDPTGAGRFFMQMIAAASGIPMRMLFGSETGERASSEDQKAYLGSIGERQVQHAEPSIIRAFLDRLIEHNALTPPATGSYNVEWPELMEVSEEERSQANLNRAKVASELTAMGGDPLELGMIDDKGDFWLVETTPDGREPLPVEPEPEEGAQ